MNRPARINGDEQIPEAGYTAIRDFLTGDPRRMRSREIAYEAVKGAILAGMFEPRQRLIEERLGEALQLSRTPIREALAILEHEGLIEAVPYKGLMVRAVTLDEFLGMYEALGMVETAVARAAASHVTDADIRRLQEILDEAERCIPDDVPGHLAACRNFQSHLGTCAGSPFLTRLLVGIEERSDVYLIHSSQQIAPENMRAAVADRRRILAAVQAGDPDSAGRAAAAHAEGIRGRWRAHYPDRR